MLRGFPGMEMREFLGRHSSSVFSELIWDLKLVIFAEQRGDWVLMCIFVIRRGRSRRHIVLQTERTSRMMILV